ncbi:MAG: F0F1 ATP synthase subunit alpha [Oscillospiraceae bacterium]|jgi:F-type H+-transporting ATPase subunit alpha|nr:F0F1 ATP synthase subunit alpha [Oscillospiraceae bacterium]
MSDRIGELINSRIDAIKAGQSIYSVGKVTRVANYILEVAGLEDVFYFERVYIGNKGEGYVSHIGRSSVTVELVKRAASIYVGDEVTSSGKMFSAMASPDFVGHIVDIFGEDKLTGNKFRELAEIPAVSPNVPIMDRRTVKKPLYTGLCGIDLLYPIGKGQRQLIIGDKKTGKTQIGLDAIANQRGQGVICIYVALGKSKKTVKGVYNELLARGAMSYTVIMAAFQEDCAPMLYITPQVALSLALAYMQQKRDVLVIMDDLTQHANTYREISLLAGKAPGRDAYPPDIFYTHASMLELGCQHKNGGSITILPIVETRGGDITDYIATNIISITDGQIVTSSKSFEKGQKPAINFGLSVSRLGGQVQIPAMKALGTSIKRELLSYLETKEIFELANIDEMSAEMRDKLTRGKEMLERMKQYRFDPMTPDGMAERFGKFAEAPETPAPAESVK